MSFIDSYTVQCNNCDYVHLVQGYGDFDCPQCGKRWILELRKVMIVDPRNRKRKSEGYRVYINGCTIVEAGGF